MECDRLRRQIRQATALVRAALAGAAPVELPPAEAAALTKALGELEKLVASAVVRYAQAAGRDATTLLASATGTTGGAARRQLRAADQIAAVPVLQAAFADGELSVDQAAVIAPVAARLPDQAPSLLAAAKGSSLRELRATAERTMRRATTEEDEVARERRLHARRYCRVSLPPGGGVHVDAFLPTVEGGRLLAALDKETDAGFAEAWAAGQAEPRERLAADALVRLVTANAVTSGAHLVVRVDAGALRRGNLEAGEVCEVEGVGQVSVATARSLLPEGYLTLLVSDGVDVTTVTSTTRVIPRRLAVALAARDPSCVVPGCGATHRLEIDHWRVDFARHGPTELSNLCRLCPTHHAMKTKQGWRLGGGPGKWRWVAPGAGPPNFSRRAPGRAGP